MWKETLEKFLKNPNSNEWETGKLVANFCQPNERYMN